MGPDGKGLHRAAARAEGGARTDMQEFCRTRLASFKRPEQIEFIDALPKNALGKILRKELQRATRSRHGKRNRASDRRGEGNHSKSRRGAPESPVHANFRARRNAARSELGCHRSGTRGRLCRRQAHTRAARNRVSAAMARELMDLAETVEDDESLLALAITGSGRLSASGFEPTRTRVWSKPLTSSPNRRSRSSMATLSRRAGTGAGPGPADGDSRRRFALTQLQRGALPHFGGTQRLPRLIGGAGRCGCC